MVAVFLGLAAYIIYDVLIDYPQNAVSIAGLALYIIIFYIFSKNPAKVQNIFRDNVYMLQFLKKLQRFTFTIYMYKLMT